MASILILEDDPVHCHLLEHEFHSDQYWLQSCGDATSALRLLREHETQYEVGIFDLDVPVQAGEFPQADAALVVIKAAREAFPSMALITIGSMFIAEEHLSGLLALGLKASLQKPFSLGALHNLVDDCLTGREVKESRANTASSA